MKQFTFLKKIMIGVTGVGVSTLLIAGLFTMVNKADAQVPPIAPLVDVGGFMWSDMPDGSDECKVGMLGGTNKINNLFDTFMMTGCGPANMTNPSAGRGFGWISAKYTITPPIGIPVDGGVKFDPVTGKFSGYAWSEHGGYMKFDPTSGYPVGLNTKSSGVHIDPACLNSVQTVCPVHGWARFVSATTDPQAGGWDGWVSFSGGDPDLLDGPRAKYGVKYDKVSGKFSGSAWGEKVVGWINCNGLSMGPIVPPPPVVCTDPLALNYNQPEVCKYDLTCSNAITGETIHYAVGEDEPRDCYFICEDLTQRVPTYIKYYPPAYNRPPACSEWDICIGRDGSNNRYKISDPINYPRPEICDTSSLYDECTDPDGVKHQYLKGTTRPAVCGSTDTDMCVFPPGVQRGSGPWTVTFPIGVTKTYYQTNVARKECSPDLCPLIDGYQSSLPCNTTTCTPGDPLCPINPGGPIKPIYIEN